MKEEKGKTEEREGEVRASSESLRIGGEKSRELFTGLPNPPPPHESPAQHAAPGPQVKLFKATSISRAPAPAGRPLTPLTLREAGELPQSQQGRPHLDGAPLPPVAQSKKNLHQMVCRQRGSTGHTSLGVRRAGLPHQPLPCSASPAQISPDNRPAHLPACFTPPCWCLNGIF